MNVEQIQASLNLISGLLRTLIGVIIIAMFLIVVCIAGYLIGKFQDEDYLKDKEDEDEG